MANLTFRDFMLDEMARREFKSAREFAHFLELDQTMVSQSISAANPRTPGLKFLVQVAEKTGAPIEQLLRLAYPDLPSETGLSPSAALFAHQFDKAPQHIQETIRLLLRGG